MIQWWFFWKIIFVKNIIVFLIKQILLIEETSAQIISLAQWLSKGWLGMEKG